MSNSSEIDLAHEDRYITLLTSIKRMIIEALQMSGGARLKHTKKKNTKKKHTKKKHTKKRKNKRTKQKKKKNTKRRR